MSPAEIAELLPYVPEDQKAELFALLAADSAIWRPLPGPQSQAFYSLADITGYGGAAGGGKTDLACGLTLTQHRRSIIFRRVGTELTAIEDRFEELLGSRDGYNGQKMIWRLGDRQVEFGACQNEGEEKKYQGRPHDLIVIDEAANFLESQVRFLFGWLRSTVPGQRCRALLNFNPPTSAEGRWLIDFFGPWLDNKHANPAKPGELRWFATVGGRDREVEDDRPFVLLDGEIDYSFDPKRYKADEIIQPLSRTFIPSRVTDNPYLAGTGYLATLQGMPEPLRSQMLHGDFTAGIEDDAFQIIPTAWIEAAQARWVAKDAKGPMDSIGVDPSRGGRDETTIARRHGVWFDHLIAFPGVASPDGPTVAGQVLSALRDKAPVHIDLIGWGASPYDFLIENKVHTVGLNGAEATKETVENGSTGFGNVRALLWWRMREALDPMNPEPISLPPDPALKADLAAPRWKYTTRGIQVELKDEIKKRLGRSPDKGDAVVMALIATPKAALAPRALKMPNYGVA